MNRKLEAFGTFLFALAFLGGGVLCVVADYNTSIVGFSGESWVAASTTITYTYGVRAYGTRNSGVEYVLSPTYTFVAHNGKIYSGNRYTIFGFDKTNRTIGSEDKLQSLLVENRQIYYNPNDPNQSAVEQPFFNPGAAIMFGIFAIFIIVMGICILINEVSSLKRHKEKRAHTLNFNH